MEDQDKTKQAPIEELAALRQKIAELKQSESRFRSYFDLPLHGIAITSADRGWIQVNDRLCAIMGYSRDEILSMTWSEMTHPDDLAADLEQLERVRSGEIDQYGMEKRFIRKDGKVVWTNISVGCIRKSDGGIDHMVALVEDVTGGRLAEEALRESEDRYRSLFANSMDAVLLTAPDGAILAANPEACRIFGYTEAEICRGGRAGLMDPRDPRLASALEERARTGQFRGELTFIRKGGTAFPGEISSVIFIDRDGHPKTSMIIRDVTERKRAEEALRNAEARYRLLFEHSPDGILIIDPATARPLEFNEAAHRQLGYSRSEFAALSIFDLEVEETPEETRARIAQVIREGRADFETRQRTRQGEIRNVHVTAQTIPILGQSVYHCIWRDITERKKAEEALRKSEELSAKLIATMPDIMVRTNLEGEILFINDVGLGVSGYRREELIGRNIFSLVAPEDQEKAARNTVLMFEKGLGPQEYHLIMKDGRTRLFEVNGDVLRDEAGNPYGMVRVCRDITERKRTGEELRIHKDRLSRAEIISRSGNWEFDLGTKRVFASDGARKIYGLHHEEWTIPEVQKIPLPEYRGMLDRALRALIEENRPYDVEFKILLPDTGEIADIHSVAEYDPSRNVVFGVIQDVTDRKLAEEETHILEERLRRSEKMEALGQLAGGVAHDLNNVLGILTGYSELLLLETTEGSRSRAHAEKILQSTEKGASIIQDLLTLARRGVTVSDVINLNTIVSGFLKTPVFEKLKDYHPRVTFRTECDRNLLNIKGSPVHLEKTLMNLVSNAAESISGVGEVTIRTESRYLDKAIRGYDEVNEGDYAVLTVSDTGMGIPAENREKIFEPFYTKKAMGRSGTGLGLAIVWGTVKDHNGYIDLRTEVGEGTTFTLYFPVTREERVAPQGKESMERYMGHGESVLVVDDIAGQRDVASMLLTRLGYRVHAVSSGEEAVEYLKKNTTDILVLDMIMAPGIDGLETYRQVVAINPGQKAVLVSGFSKTDRVREAQKLGAGAYVRKPYAMEKIGVAIRDELNRS